MKRVKKIVFWISICPLLILQISARSQSTDYVILSNRDTLKGDVKQMGRSKIIVTHASKKNTKLKAEDVYSFKNGDKKFYSVEFVDYNSNSLYKTYFMKCEVEGYLKLLSFAEQKGFVNPANAANPVNTGYSTSYFIRVGESNESSGVRRIDDLIKYVSDNNDLVAKIENKEFKRTDLESVVKEYNKWRVGDNDE